MSATINTTHRLDLIKDIVDGQFKDITDVVLLACPNYPIITQNANQYPKEHDMYANTKEFLDHRLIANHNSLDELATELGFTDAKKAFDFAYDAIDNHKSTAINKLLAKQYGAVYLNSIAKISILASTASLDDIAQLAKMIGPQDNPNSLLLYLNYVAEIDHPMSYQHAVNLAQTSAK